MSSTFSHVRDDIYRINAPAMNAALTRNNGTPSDELLKLIFDTVPVPKRAVMTDYEFRRGRQSKHWYFKLTHRFAKKINPVGDAS